MYIRMHHRSLRYTDTNVYILIYIHMYHRCFRCTDTNIYICIYTCITGPLDILIPQQQEKPSAVDK